MLSYFSRSCLSAGLNTAHCENNLLNSCCVSHSVVVKNVLLNNELINVAIEVSYKIRVYDAFLMLIFW